MKSSLQHAPHRRVRHRLTGLRTAVPRAEIEASTVPASWSPGLRTVAGSALLYLVAVAVATFPMIRHLATKFPSSMIDPLQHLWVMRWYKSCLLSGRAPWVCPEIQYPVGAHLGNFSPMQLQSLLYLPLSLVIRNDLLCYNLIWLAAFLFTGLSVMILAWNVVSHRPSAVLAGLAAMLSMPVMMRAQGHLELMCVGAVPLFLTAWLRWLERPSRRGLFACVAQAGLVTMSAAYFIIYTVFPATLLLVYEVVRRGRADGLAWLRARAPGLIAFGLLGLTLQAALFAPQLMMRLDRTAMIRTRAEFHASAVPPWGYLIPSQLHRLHALFPVEAYEKLGYSTFNGCAYVGLVVLAMLHHTAVRRVRFPRSRYWWLAFGLMAVLSCGATWTVGRFTIPMPASWLWSVFPPLRQTRDPARFNLIAVCLAAVVAAAGFRSWLRRWPERWQRAGLCGIAAAVMVFDLQVRFPVQQAPLPMPAAYDLIRQRNPHARLLEAPTDYSEADSLLSAQAAYWQQEHGLSTSAGYSGFGNARFNDLILHDGPFNVFHLTRPQTYADPGHAQLGLLRDTPARDLIWLFLTHHQFDYVVWHRWHHRPGAEALDAGPLPALLADAAIFEDHRTRVFETARLSPPQRPVMIHTEGWRTHYATPFSAAAVEAHAELEVYSPRGDLPLVIALEARGYHGHRTVTLRQGERLLARWEMQPGQSQTYRSPPFVLDPGVHTLTLESDSAHTPTQDDQRIPVLHPGAYSLIATALRLETSVPEPRSATLAPGEPRPDPIAASFTARLSASHP